MRYWLGFGLVLILVLLQTSALPLFSIFGTRPDLLLVVLMAWMLARGLPEALPLAALAGLLLGFLGAGSPGVPLIALALVAVLAAGRELRLLQPDLLALLVAFAGSLVYQFVFLVSASLGGRTVGWADAFSVVLPAAVINAVVMVPAYRAMALTVRPAIHRVLA